jgi:hypothetical protein
MTTQFQIDKNIPISSGYKPKTGSKYPFAKLEVGDSFFVKADNKKHATIRRDSISALARKHGEETGKKFAFRVLEESGVWGFRAWRTE